jgi:hypothetical protein
MHALGELSIWSFQANNQCNKTENVAGYDLCFQPNLTMAEKDRKEDSYRENCFNLWG